MRTLMLILAAAACAAPGAAGEQSELDYHIRGRTPGPPQRCVPITSRREGLRAVDAQTVIYRSGATTWVNRLQHECPGLRPLVTIAVDTIAGRYCRGDPVRPLEAGARTPRAVCALGDFTPYRRQ